MPEDDPRTQVMLLLAGLGALVLGFVTLTRRPALPIPPPEPPIPPPPPPPVGPKLSPCPPLGDVNNDGFVTDVDAQLILRHDAGLITLNAGQLARADVNQDGVVNPIDATLILQYVEGLSPNPFTCPRS